MSYRLILNKFLGSDNIIFTFLRSGLSSAITALTDLSVRILCYSFLLISLSPLYRSNISVLIGTIIGGLVNFTINRKFTFHASNQNNGVIMFAKYLFVWAGGLLLNVYGTYGMQSLLQILLSNFLMPDNQLFAIATFITACIVSVLWNFLMQRYFVFRK